MRSLLLSVALGLAISPHTVQSNPAWPPVMPFGVIKGSVRDAHANQPLGYANVTLMNTTFGAMSQKDGSFVILFVPPGNYTVKTMMMGYHTVSQADVVVGMGKETDLSFSLEEKWPTSQTDERSIVGTETSATKADILCEIVPLADRFHVGEALTFRVVIRNVGSESFYLVRALDGSFEGFRYPMMSIAVKGPDRDSATGGGACGNVNPIEPEDFTLVQPSGGFEPFNAYVSNELFAEAGEYKVTFSYSTNAIDYKFWTDRLGPMKIDSRAHELLKSVPRVKLEESITVQVVD